VSVYGPRSEKTEDEREASWETLSESVNGFKQCERIVVLGDMNVRVGDLKVEEVISKFGVPVVNWAGRRMVQFFTEAGLIAGNTWFKKKLVNKYTWMRDNGANEALTDWMLVDKRIKDSLKDVNVLSSWVGVGVIGSGHLFVAAKMCWRRTRYKSK
jgi:exonuclease III